MVEHKAFDRVHFPDILFQKKCELPSSIPSLFPCVDYLLLKPEHISVTRPFLGGVPY
jgi:hypothetical protein